VYTAIKRPGRNGNAMWTTTTGFNRADVCVYAQLSEHVDVGLHAYRLAVTVLVALPGRIRRGLVIVPGPSKLLDTYLDVLTPRTSGFRVLPDTRNISTASEPRPSALAPSMLHSDEQRPHA